MPATEQRGSAVGVYVDISGTPTLVAARRGFEYNETTDTIETTSTSSGDWKEFMASLQEGEATLDALHLIDDQTGSVEASQQHIIDAKRNGNTVEVERRLPGEGTGEKITCIVTDITYTANYDEAAQISVTLKQTGAPS